MLQSASCVPIARSGTFRCVAVPFVENQSLKKYIGGAIDVTEHELLTQELRRREAYNRLYTQDIHNPYERSRNALLLPVPTYPAQSDP
jgi:hypothetical protein